MSVEKRLLSIFSRVFRDDVTDTSVAVADISEWDSMSHIRLIMEIERDFRITITPEEIPTLYTDFATVQQFIASRVPE